MNELLPIRPSVKGISKHAKMRPAVMGTKCRLAQNVTKIKKNLREKGF
jgi:hypothetical protein